MKRIVFLLITFLGASYNLAAQRLIMESKAGLSASYASITPVGETLVTKGSFTTPAFFANFNGGSGFTLDYNQFFAKNVLAGIRLSSFSFSSWQPDSLSKSFKGASASVIGLEAGLTLSTAFRERGLFNKTSFQASVFPGVYQVRADIPKAYSIEQQGNAEPVEQSVVSKAIRPGVNLGVGIVHSATTKWSFILRGTYQIISLKSNFYRDETARWIQINAGITYRMKKNKRYIGTRYE